MCLKKSNPGEVCNVVLECESETHFFSKNRRARVQVVADLNPVFKQIFQNKKMRVQVGNQEKRSSFPKTQKVFQKQKSECQSSCPTKSTVQAVFQKQKSESPSFQNRKASCQTKKSTVNSKIENRVSKQSFKIEK